VKKQLSVAWCRGCRALLTVLIVLGMLLPSAPGMVQAQEPPSELQIPMAVATLPADFLVQNPTISSDYYDNGTLFMFT